MISQANFFFFLTAITDLDLFQYCMDIPYLSPIHLNVNFVYSKQTLFGDMLLAKKSNKFFYYWLQHFYMKFLLLLLFQI